VVVLRSRDLNEVPTREFRFLSGDDLQVRGHPIIFGCVFSVDFAHYE